MEFKDYYQMLGVDRNVTADELKKAFRKLARKYHPDISKEADAELRMKEINEAYAVLSDPEKRAAYDQIGQGARPGQDFRPPPDWDAGFEFSGGPSPHETADFSEFFTELFGRMNGGQPGRRSAHARPRGRGEDHHAKVLLDLEDAFNGATRQITLRVPQLDDQGRVALATRTLNVKIPVGVRAGQIIRLAGQGAGGLGAGGLGADGLGADGPGAAPAGDLLLEVQFRPHPRFQVDGRDLHMPLPVTPWEAALGGVVTVELPHGNVKVRIPAGAQGGRRVRVRGKGLPGEPAGDLLLELQVVLPPADTPQARTLYETMARELAFDPRQSPKG